jgi:outer membrane protein assembly factor BamB
MFDRPCAIFRTDLPLRWAKLGVALMLAWGLGATLGSSSAWAQFEMDGADEEQSEEEEQQAHPFLLPSQPTEIAEALEDFRRFVRRKQWEKAFKHLEIVLNSPSNGLVPGEDGILLPSRLIARDALTQLPSAGQDAYRLFYDAEAKRLLEQAKGKDEQEKLSQLASKFLITASGDVAADRLGDLYFEAGDFSQAAQAWRSILNSRLDSRLSRARLWTKIGIALARLRRWNELRDVLTTVREQHAKDLVALGGQQVSAVEHLEKLLAHEKDAGQSPGDDAPLPDISLAGDPKPLWQFRLFPKPDPNNRQGGQGLFMMNPWGWGQRTKADMIMPIALDQSRLYANFIGYDLGIDLASGKLQWRSGRFLDVLQKAQNGLFGLERYGMTVAGDRVWSVTHDVNKLGQHEQFPLFSLVSREAATGKETFNSEKVDALKEWSLYGTPLTDGDRVYVPAKKQNQQDVHIIAISATAEPKLLWSTSLGTYKNQQQMWYYSMERATQPSLLLHDGHLYADTHAGSLLTLDASSGRIDWAVNYVSETSIQHRFMWWGMPMNNNSLTVSPPMIVDGILYVKGMKSNRLYAIDPQRPKVLWKRPVSKSAVLIGVDDDNFYLGGEDISAYDLTTRRILWSVKVNMATTWGQPLMTKNRIYHFDTRGIYEINKTDGRVMHLFRGADLESLGGVLKLTPKALLAISNLAVTAYPLGTATPPTTASTEAGTASTEGTTTSEAAAKQN